MSPSIVDGGALISPYSDIPFGGAFNPTSLITGAGGFWRADMGVTGSPSVTGWADQSSFASNLIPCGSDPQFSATGFNSAKPGIAVADGSTQGMQFSFTSFISTTVTVFWLMQYHSGNTQTFGRFCSFVVPGAPDDFSTAHVFESDDTATHNNLQFANNNTNPGNGGSAGPALVANSLYLVGIVFDGANANRWSAGAVVGSGTANTNTIGATGADLFSIGQQPGFGTPAAGATYAFFGFTQKAMNSTDWGNLKTWSNSNWGTSF